MSSNMIIGLIGGLGLFIYGMNMMSDSLKAVAGDRMKQLLEILTNKRIMGIIVGTIVTLIVQSSSTTTVMIIGFVNAGLMNLAQAAGVILGANIGTTITAQMIALDVTSIAPLFVGAGVLLKLISKKKRTRQIGEGILGFGILFMGINTMSASMVPLRNNPLFIDILISFGKKPLMGLLAGTAITAIMQSSSASLGLLQAIAISGAFDSMGNTSALSVVIPIILGMNIGTCVTAMLSSIGASIAAKKAALMHLFMKIFGSLWVMILLGLINSVVANNPLYEFLIAISGQKVVGGQVIPDVTRQIANFHTLFNILNMVVLIPLIDYVIKFVNYILPNNTNEEDSRVQLDERMLENPSIAIGQLFKEVERMGRLSVKNLKLAVEAIVNKDEELCQEVYKRERLVNDIEKDITHYLIMFSNSTLSEAEHNDILSLFNCIHDIERISDHAENLAELAEYRIDNKVSFSNTAVDELNVMINTVIKVAEDVVEAIVDKDTKVAVQAMKREHEINKMEKDLRKSHIDRLNGQVCKPSSGVIYLDILGNLERIGDHATNIAEYILD